jgi:hypothetical protein
MQDHLCHRGLVFQEIIQFFGNIENDDDDNKYPDCKQESRQVFPDDITINDIHFAKSKFKNKKLKVRSFS